LKNLKGIIDYRILYRKGHNVDLEAFVEFDWVGDPNLENQLVGTSSKLETL
jgi:hypothetical protein